jgi:hypothetical protein
MALFCMQPQIADTVFFHQIRQRLNGRQCKFGQMHFLSGKEKITS